MANTYATVPNVLPGNVTIGGTLTVSGDFIRIGAASPFCRVGKSTIGGAILTYNVGNDVATRDNGAAAAASLELLRTGGQFARMVLTNPAGNVDPTLLDETFHQTGTSLVNTGNVTENTIYTKVLNGNTLQSHGALVVQTLLVGTVQGGVATTFRLKLGASVLFAPTSAAVKTILLRMWLLNQAVTNAQRAVLEQWESTGFVGVTQNTFAVDTTVNQALALTIQNGAAADSWTAAGWKVQTFAPTDVAI